MSDELAPQRKGHQFAAGAENPRVKDPSKSGRRKGTPNKMTATFKEAIAIAYQGIGGHDAFTKWAKDHKTEFYRIAARLIPTELVGGGDDGEHVVRVVHDAR